MFHFSMEKVKSASRGIFWLGGALPAVGSLFTDFLSPLGPYSFFLALLLGMLTVLALIAAVIPPVNRVLHSWSAHWAEGVLAVLLCGFLVFSGMFALELSTDPHKGFLASESEKLAEIQKILLNIADTTARMKAVAVASRNKIDIQKAVSIGKNRSVSELPFLFSVGDRKLMDGYQKIKKLLFSSDATFTIGDLIIIYAKDNVDKIVQFMHEYTIPHDKGLKLRRELADYFSTCIRQMKREFGEIIIKEAEKYVHVTQQLEKALGVSR